MPRDFWPVSRDSERADPKLNNFRVARDSGETQACSSGRSIPRPTARNVQFQCCRQCPGKRGGLNGSTQHFLAVYSQESENLKFVVGVDLSAVLLCSDPTGNSRLGLCSSGSIVVRARLCFRSSRVARDFADRRSKLSHPWPP